MQAVKAYYDGRTFVPTIPVNIKKNRAVIVTILDDEILETETQEPDPNGWKKCIGSISKEDCDLMMATIEEGCEKADLNEW
ncbi:MAG: hypothetical protein Ta2F_16830 [Termitinemataceae bacterium]|nr:MAG: hypothetical protein Ta2F_16830 [Termitinemataceae bacterium]